MAATFPLVVPQVLQINIYMDLNATRYISVVRFGSTSAVFCSCGILLVVQFNEHFLL
jgi:hypothetical protein